MTAQELIDVLNQIEDKDIANIEIFTKDDEYFEIKNIGQFSLCTDVTFQIEKIAAPPLLSQPTFKRKHKKMVDKKMKEIKKDLKKNGY